MKKQIVKIIFLPLILALTACGNGPSLTSTVAYGPSSTSAVTQGAESTAASTITVPKPAFTHIAETASPRATGILMITPEPTQLAMWTEYETALGKKLTPAAFTTGRVLCEWQILSESEQVVFVWSECMGTVPVGNKTPPAYPSASIPAVIHLGTDGSVQNVEVPGAGESYGPDIRSMFPPTAQKMIFDNQIDLNTLSDHLKFRLEHPEVPPLIVLSATPLP